MLHPLSISPFLFCFPRPFLSLWFHPAFPPAVTPSQFPLVFHSSFYNPPLSAFVIRAVTEQCLQGLPRGLPMWHICFTTTHLTSPSSPSLYSGQIIEEETENILPTNSSLPLYASPLLHRQTLPPPAALSKRWQTGRRPSYLSAQMEPRLSRHRGCTAELG